MSIINLIYYPSSLFNLLKWIKNTLKVERYKLIYATFQRDFTMYNTLQSLAEVQVLLTPSSLQQCSFHL